MKREIEDGYEGFGRMYKRNEFERRAWKKKGKWEREETSFMSEEEF